MIIGIGLDLVSVQRMAHWLEDPRLCLRYFHPSEFETIQQRGRDAAKSLAARFAAKEAFGKALGTGFAGLRLRDIRVENESSGRPRLYVEGTAASAMAELGARHIHLSITHDGDIAAAQIILEA